MTWTIQINNSAREYKNVLRNCLANNNLNSCVAIMSFKEVFFQLSCLFQQKITYN